MKIFLIAALLAVLPFTVNAQGIDREPAPATSAEFILKPVLCMNKDTLFERVKSNNMTPLMGAIGNSFDGTGSTFEAFFLVVYNAEEGTYTFVELHPNGWACMLGGGTNNLIFDMEEIDRQLGWD